MPLIDIDLNEFDNDDIIREVESRMTAKYVKFDSKEIKELRDILSIPQGIQNENLDDQMKIDHLSSVWGKYTSADIERLLP